MAQAQPPLTAAEVGALFPAATPRSNIARYWPHISSALAEEGLGDRAMALLALPRSGRKAKGLNRLMSIHRSGIRRRRHPYGLYDERQDWEPRLWRW